MRIGFDAKRYFLNKSGLGNYSRDLVRILETYYPENEYIKFTPKIKGPSLGDKTIKLPKSRLHNLFPSVWRNNWIVNDLVKDKIDIFHGLSGEIPIGLSKKGIKSVVTIHDLIFLKFPELYKRLDRVIYNRKFKYAIFNADKVVAISEQTKRDIVEFYNFPAEKIDIIYQGCHPAFKIKKSAIEKAYLRNKYNLPENFVLNVGSIEPRKNAFQIVKAIETLDIPLVIIGKETKYSNEIKAYIHSKGLQNKVFMLQGFTMEELSTIYSMAELFVYPSKYEGFGIPIIEALYSGTPVITSNSGVFPEAGGPFSYYVNPESIEELRYAINAVLNNTSMRQEMITKGMEFVQKFNDDKIASQWNKVYTDLIG
ncbi:glycosyltransferase family 4 protein [Sphingobacterium composti Ten et al. 2007 non Yoo et al. 2007]|uniref:glycosyltransferase family 4 protein n=1 Tax=Sphingobacterium composti TaxID=363260 RepID=UPI00135B82B0|nr:glycosyltransferase family 1 protein [Sphingobacterium composti Ten et al. 2007 non Yoo et al. 2007]